MITDVNQLTGAALDWAVAKCEGMLAFGYRTDGERFAINNSDGEIEAFMPSSFWVEGGPIIERERLSVAIMQGDPPVWHASCPRYVSHGYGSSPLIAAMRCYVVSKLGSTVDVPDELFGVV